MLDQIPAELQEHVTLLSTHEWFDRLVPRRAGCTNNPFFRPNECTHRVPSVERHEVSVPIPDELRLVYERYPDDTEFTAPGDWTFMSEKEMVLRRNEMLEAGQVRLVDLALTYSGMGHVSVLSFDPCSKFVLTSMDGGANGWDRQQNREARIEMSVEDVHKVPFATWWKQLTDP